MDEPGTGAHDPVAALAERLRALRMLAGNPSVNRLVDLTEQQGRGRAMRRSTIQDKLHGTTTPKLEHVLALVAACAEHAVSIDNPLPAGEADADQWQQAWFAMMRATAAPRRQRQRAARADAVLEAAERAALSPGGRSPASAPAPHGVPRDPFPGRSGEPATRPATRPISVGEGEPSVTAAFEGAYAAAGGPATLGRPLTVVVPMGPGHVQRFGGGSDHEPAVICCLGGRPAAVVPASIWDALCKVGGRSADLTGVAAAGFPVRQPDPPGQDQPLVIGGSATTVDLLEGAWGPGRLVRSSPAHPWIWQPTPRVTFDLTHNRRWTGVEPVDLLVRAVADLPWRTAEPEPEITRARRARLQRALATTELANAIPVLSTYRGARVAAPQWTGATGHNSYQSDRGAHFRAALSSPDGTAALSVEVILQLPDRVLMSSVLGCAELRVNFAAWRAALEAIGVQMPEDAASRLSIGEIVEVLIAAWDVATMVAPLAAVDDPVHLPPTAPPFVEMHLQTSAPIRTSIGRQLLLSDVIDMSAFGEPAREDTRRETGMRVTAPLGIDRQHRRRLVVSGLARLARSWSYIDADEDDLLAKAGPASA